MPHYNIYFSGQVQDEQDPALVRDKLSTLFNADQQTLDRLFSGKPQLIKKGCDKATAVKYKQAMERAGAVPVIRTASEEAPQAEATAQRPMSAAERIAALAAAPDAMGNDTAAAGQSSAQPTTSEDGEFDVAPAGADVLRPEERPQHAPRDIDTSGLLVDDAGQRLSEQAPPPPQAPDTGHLSMGDVGEEIPNLPHAREPLSPDTDALQLAEDGWDLSDCAAPDPEAPSLDLTGLDLAPAGTDVLEEQYRRKQQAQAPDTDHIALSD